MSEARGAGGNDAAAFDGTQDALVNGRPDAGSDGKQDSLISGRLDAGVDGTGTPRDAPEARWDTNNTPAGLDALDAAGPVTSGQTDIEISRGMSKLIDLFVGTAGIYVLTSDAFYLMDRTGAEIVRRTLDAPVTTAAFDGSLFVLADETTFRTYDSALGLVGSGDLLEPCFASILVSGHRFVCGPSYDWDRVFFTYDALSGRLIASSDEYTYDGLSMKRVPGTDDFVSVYSSQFNLYTVSASGQVVLVNDMSYQDNIRVTSVFSFDGEPAVHLVTDTGHVLTIRTSNCAPFGSGCFVEDGAQIPAGDTYLNNFAFAAMDFDTAGRVYGLVDYIDGFRPLQFGTCTDGCKLDRLDVPSRTVLSTRVVRLPGANMAAFRHDPIGNNAVIGYNTIGKGDAGLASQGYGVAVISYTGTEIAVTGGTNGGVPGDGGMGGTTGTDGGTRDAGPDGGREPARMTDLASGTATLVDVFAGESGVYVVTSAGVTLIDRGGSPVNSVSSDEVVTSAAFDGYQLVLTAQTKLTAYNPSLAQVGVAALVKQCAAGVLISNHRFVCGPSNDWGRVFYTYDTLTGQLVASSKEYTYNGIPMKRIPGTDDFITVTNLSPPSYSLYSVMSDGVATYINREGEPSITALPIFAFDGAPPVHLISQWGGMATIYGPDCLSNPEARTSTCLLKDGSLGVLTGSQQFDGMDSDAMGNLFGLVDMIDPITDPPCSHGCLLETIKVATQTVVSQRVVHLTMKKFVAFRHDPIAGAALVGYTQAQASDGGQQTLYHVVSIPY